MSSVLSLICEKKARFLIPLISIFILKMEKEEKPKGKEKREEKPLIPFAKYDMEDLCSSSLNRPPL